MPPTRSCAPVVLAALVACSNQPPGQSSTDQAIDIPLIKGSQVFCGNVRIWNDDCSPNMSNAAIGWAYSPYQPHYCGTSDGVPQYAPWTPQCLANSDVEARYAATQNFEVRGWILPAGFSGDPEREYDDENEYHMDIMVDIGWTPEPSGPLGSVVPLNTLPALMAYLPGNNIIEFGGRNFNTASYGNTMWGGAGQAVIHLEVDGWGPGRGGASYASHVPVGWFQHGFELQPIFEEICIDPWTCTQVPVGSTSVPLYWPTDLAPPSPTADHAALQPGEYVSVIGTQWRDGAHILCHWWPFGCDGGAQNQAKLCFRNHTGQNHWAEIHSPDLIRRMPEPPPAAHHDVIGYASCSDDPVTLDDTVNLTPPFPNSRIASIQQWTTGQSYTAAPPSYGTASAAFHIASQGATVAYYDVTWACTPTCAGRCGSNTDGCGGSCAAASCPASQVCTGAWCGCPSGLTTCPGQGDQCVASCPPFCGDGTCSSGETCSSCPTDCGDCPPDTCPRGRSDCCGTGACLTPTQCRRVCP